MATNTTAQPKPAELLAALVDRGYTTATRQVIAALARDSQVGALAERLAQFDAHAAELAAAGEAIKADDPYLRAMIAEFGTALRKGALLIDAAAPDVQAVGIDAAGTFVRQTTLPGMSDQQLLAVGIGWNRPDPEAVAQVVQYTTSGAWQDELKSFGDLENQAMQIALRGIVAGQNPVTTARDLRQAITGFPAWRANNILRTLQLTAFRDAAVVAQVANADILEPEVIRIAALDGRTCMACVALHGTKVPLGERINDHRQGRCTSITQLKGRPVTVRSGEEWFNGLSEAQQRAQMGPGAWTAWKAGAIGLQDFVQRGTDGVFGAVVTEASLKGMLGDAARQYYQRGPRGGGGAGAGVPDAMIATVYGMVKPDVGTVGDTVESLNTFLQTSNGPLAQAIKRTADWDNPTPALDLDWDTNQYRVNSANVYSMAKAFVAEGRGGEYSGAYLLSVWADKAAENGVTVANDRDAKVLYNRHYATEANVILTLARIGGVKLTDPQTKWLTQATEGNYFAMSTATEQARRLRQGPITSSGRVDASVKAARTIARQDFLRNLLELDGPFNW